MVSFFIFLLPLCVRVVAVSCFCFSFAVGCVSFAVCACGVIFIGILGEACGFVLSSFRICVDRSWLFVFILC